MTMGPLRSKAFANLLTLYFVWILLPGAAVAQPAGYFPFIHTPEIDLPAYARFRAEGMPFSEAFWHGFKYVAKYRHKRFSAPAEEIRYFDAQRKLLRFLTTSAVDPAHNLQVNLAMVGDIMWIRSDWDSFVAKEILDSLNRFDVVLGNLETIISPNFKVRGFWPDYRTYNSHPDLLNSFRRHTGGNIFSALSIANNHTMDYSDRGISDTIEFLDGNRILHSGVGTSKTGKRYTTFVRNGIKFGFYAATYGLNDPGEGQVTKLSLNILSSLAPETEKAADLSQVKEVLAAMDAEGVDFKIVSLHWGFEFEFYPSPKTMQVGREIVAAGADVIMGSHPHVLQPSEVCYVNGYEERHGRVKDQLAAMSHPAGCLLKDGNGKPRKALILYSLGNFTTAMYTFFCEVGIIQNIRVTKNEASGAVDWGLPGYELVYNLRRDPVTQKRAVLLMDDYLRQNCRQNECPEDVVQSVAFLHRHLRGTE
ncbi:MAG TPA: CapA family protein [Candidatus Binatia bacterium]|jgi:poly-gamma-glutamate synthesis protein (capsule biosynthesis protein)